ncbi:uncharacterized protein LOC122247720 [Penaeus japonicus]|uniref:uncharacterized protein LOC122247720 n=1 Tax=Penaeus japonicus TaxID=27405 RepID=UPI001C7142EF|nr:uncharacterized protein LOC122247720 [Penaeus japonicus]
MMEETWKLLSVKGMRTTPYHPEGNGLCERFNGTLKKMLKRMAADQPREWPASERSIVVLRGVDNITGPSVITSSYQYVLADSSNVCILTCELAKEELLKSQATQKSYTQEGQARTEVEISV